MLSTTIRIHLALTALTHRAAARLSDERGQTSAEYALVLLGAAAVAVLVGVWAKNTDQIGKLLDAIFGNISKMAKG